MNAKDSLECDLGLMLEIRREEGNAGFVMLFARWPKERAGKWTPLFPDEVRAVRNICNRVIQEMEGGDESDSTRN